MPCSVSLKTLAVCLAGVGPAPSLFSGLSPHYDFLWGILTMGTSLGFQKETKVGISIRNPETVLELKEIQGTAENLNVYIFKHDVSCYGKTVQIRFQLKLSH